MMIYIMDVNYIYPSALWYWLYRCLPIPHTPYIYVCMCSNKYNKQQYPPMTDKSQKHQKHIRLQIKGNSDFNFILPASPEWRVSTLEEHMIKIYNQVCANQLTNNAKATQIKSLKRNGYYVASSLKVGAVFNDWDQVTCQIIVKRVDRQNQEKDLQEMKKILNKPHEEKNGEESRKSKASQDRKQQKKNQNTKKNQDTKNTKKSEHKKQQKASDKSILPASKLLGMLQKIQHDKSQDKASQKADQRAPQKQKQETPKQSKQSAEKKKPSKTIIVEPASDSD